MRVTPATSEASVWQLQGEPRPIERSELDQPPVAAAEVLVGAVLQRPRDPQVRVRIVEVEAYGPDDPASHAFRGPTPRCAAMFAPSGTAYVYRSYGVHWCVNVSVGGEGTGAAVLLRSGVVLTGVDEVRTRRPGVEDAGLLRGPGCLTKGLAIDGTLDGADLLASTSPWQLMVDDATLEVAAGPRVGVSRAVDLPWRRYVVDCAAVSRYRRSPRAQNTRGDHQS